MKKIDFYDIDGTLTSEIDGSIPQSAITAIRKARANGNLMFLNTGRCIQNVEPRFQEVGFDGFVCGCGTDIYCGGKNLLHVTQSHEITMELLKAAPMWTLFSNHPLRLLMIRSVRSFIRMPWHNMTLS